MSEFTVSDNLTPSDIVGIKQCFLPVTRTFQKGQSILNNSTDSDTLGIMLSGTAYLVTSNSEGQRRILEYYRHGNIIGKCYLPPVDDKDYYVVAKTSCTIDFISRKKLLTCCSKVCTKHIKMIDGLMASTTRKSLMHIDVLSQRSLRSKLISFFGYIRMQKKSDSFTLPLPLTDLADYLAVDRSAMMREIKKLNDEGIITSDKRKITLHHGKLL